MASLNKAFLMGNLTRDPELRYTTGGTAVCSFGLAMNRRYTTSQGEDREEVCFVDIESWGRTAETCDRYLNKGAPVMVEGRLKLDQWQDRQTGQRRSRLRVRAEQVHFLGQPSRGTSFDEPGAGSGNQSPPERREDDGDRGSDRDMPPFEQIDQVDDNIPF